MSILNLASGANSFVYPQTTLETVTIILILLSIIAMLISIYRDFKRMSRERAQGKHVVWYKRSTSVLNAAFPILILVEIINEISTSKIFPYSYSYLVIVIVLIGIFLGLIFYGLQLWNQERS